MKFSKLFGKTTLLALAGVMLSGCAIEIEGANFRADTTWYKCKVTDKGELEDDRTDDICSLTLDIRVRITIDLIDHEMTVYQSKFKLNHEKASFHMEVLNKQKDSYTIYGPKSNPEDEPNEEESEVAQSTTGTLKTYWVHIIADYGGGLPYAEVQEYKAGLKLSYDGHNLPVTPGIVYS